MRRKTPEKELSAREAASPSAEAPYTLRPTAAATWLGARVPATQVAEWARHHGASTPKCVAGQEDDAKRRIRPERSSRAVKVRGSRTQRERPLTLVFPW
jgi:hypothetical protein